MNIFGSIITKLQIGNDTFDIPKPETKNILTGYGDTIEVGDVVYVDDGRISNSLPVKILVIGANDDFITWMGLHGRNFSGSCGPGWKRNFRLADKETTDKVNLAAKFHDLCLKVYVDFNTPKTNEKYFKGTVFVSACWIAWVGDLKKALLTADTSYGKLKNRDIVRWDKSGLYDSSKSKVKIPDSFPVEL